MDNMPMSQFYKNILLLLLIIIVITKNGNTQNISLIIEDAELILSAHTLDKHKEEEKTTIIIDSIYYGNCIDDTITIINSFISDYGSYPPYESSNNKNYIKKNCKYLFFLKRSCDRSTYSIIGYDNNGVFIIRNDSIIYNNIPYNNTPLQIDSFIHAVLDYKKDVISKSYNFLDSSYCVDFSSKSYIHKMLIEFDCRNKLIKNDDKINEKHNKKKHVNHACPVVSAIKQNILYNGLNNPIQVGYNKLKENEELTIQSNPETEIINLGSGFFEVIPHNIKDTSTIFYICIKNKENNIDTIDKKYFRVKLTPIPIPTIGGKYNGDKIKRNHLLAAGSVIPVVDYSDFYFNYLINYYQVKNSFNNAIYEAHSAAFTEDIRCEFSKLPAGTSITFFNIVVIGASGIKREMENIKLIIIDE